MLMFAVYYIYKWRQLLSIKISRETDGNKEYMTSPRDTRNAMEPQVAVDIIAGKHSIDESDDEIMEMGQFYGSLVGELRGMKVLEVISKDNNDMNLGPYSGKFAEHRSEKLPGIWEFKRYELQQKMDIHDVKHRGVMLERMERIRIGEGLMDNIYSGDQRKVNGDRLVLKGSSCPCYGHKPGLDVYQSVTCKVKPLRPFRTFPPIINILVVVMVVEFVQMMGRSVVIWKGFMMYFGTKGIGIIRQENKFIIY